MARGVDGRRIFEDEVDRLRFLETLSRVSRESEASIISYCLMDNHFHLLVKVHRIPLSVVIQRILTRYSMTFNMRHGRTGHLLQARYKAMLILDEAYLLRLVRYIHDNPVRAGLASAATDWRWSSAAAHHGRGEDSVITMGLLPKILGEELDEAAFDPWHDSHQGEPVLLRPPRQESLESPPFDACLSETGLAPEFLRNRARDKSHVEGRRRFVRSAVSRGLAVTDIARWLGVTPAAVLHLSNRPSF